MSYTKTTWVSGDTITAEKLNKIENRIENASQDFIIDCTSGEVYVGMDLTPADFYNAVIVYSDDGDWVRVGSTATNLNTITFRNTESNSDFYFYYRFSDGCVVKHVSNG